jgi:hypothetical protein
VPPAQRCFERQRQYENTTYLHEPSVRFYMSRDLTDSGAVTCIGWACYVNARRWVASAIEPHLLMVRFGDFLVYATTRIPLWSKFHEVL